MSYRLETTWARRRFTIVIAVGLHFACLLGGRRAAAAERRGGAILRFGDELGGKIGAGCDDAPSGPMGGEASR